jgi:colanic acid/amylovoran biosynthesis protein
MKILVTGLTTLHWGRMEFGNAGNYYISAPFFREIYKVFPKAEIATTLQFSDEFCRANKLRLLPLESYYAWRGAGKDLDDALKEYAIASIYQSTGSLPGDSIFIKEVLNSDLVLFFHGDMWGDNADANGENRFFVDILKTRTAQLLGKKTVMIASSPGPVTSPKTLGLARIVYENLTAAINRESYSKKIMEGNGFDVSKTYSYACPAFLFSKEHYPEPVNVENLYADAGISLTDDRKNIGVIPATYSVQGGSFDQWNWDEKDFESFVELVEYIINEKNDNVILIPHAYGFEVNPDFKRIHWRDYKMLCQIYDLLRKRGKIDMQRLFRLDLILYPWESHAFLGKLDMLVSGRVHGSVGALSQRVPTLAISYKSGPLAHKMTAFFELVGMACHVVPRNEASFIRYFEDVYGNLADIKDELERNLPSAKNKAVEAFSFLKRL